MSKRPKSIAAIVIGMVVALAVAILPAAASAEVHHPFLENFGSAQEQSFRGAVSIAVDQQTGDVYVAEYAGENQAIKRLNFKLNNVII